jgi:hypothetical protein
MKSILLWLVLASFCGAIEYPSNFDMFSWRCQSSYGDDALLASQGYVIDKPMSHVNVDERQLSFVDGRVNVALILIRRNSYGQARFKYLASRGSQVWQTWSSSKVFAVASAASRLRERCSLGLSDSAVKGKNSDKTPLADLITIICDYDVTQGYSSNGLARYFLDVGGRQRLDALVKLWLRTEQQESLGGNYGSPAPPDLGFEFSGGAKQCSLEPLLGPSEPIANHLSALGSAEFLRRIALFEQVGKSRRVPFTQLNDSLAILYGAGAHSTLFPATTWGGMSSDPSERIERALNMSDIERRSDGRWRLFTKDGAGYSSTRSVGEIIDNSYACFPVLDGSGAEPLANVGVEFVLSARSHIAGANMSATIEQAGQVLDAAIAQIVQSILNGTIA